MKNMPFKQIKPPVKAVLASADADDETVPSTEGEAAPPMPEGEEVATEGEEESPISGIIEQASQLSRQEKLQLLEELKAMCAAKPTSKESDYEMTADEDEMP